MEKNITIVNNYRTQPLPKSKVVKRYVRPTYNYAAILIFSLIGLIFSGYLAYQQMSGVCNFSEGCSYLVGLPVCFYGFILFFLLSVFAFVSFISEYKFARAIRLFSAIGFVFSFIYFIYELFFATSNILNGASYTLFLPICFYGFVCYLIINSLSR